MLLNVLRSGLLLLLLSLCLRVNVLIHFVFFLIRVDLLRVINIDSEVEGCVLDFSSLDFCCLSYGFWNLSRSSNVSFHWLTHGIVCSRHSLCLIFTIKIITDFERFSTLFGVAIFFTIHFFVSNLNYRLKSVSLAVLYLPRGFGVLGFWGFGDRAGVGVGVGVINKLIPLLATGRGGLAASKVTFHRL